MVMNRSTLYECGLVLRDDLGEDGGEPTSKDFGDDFEGEI